MSVTFFLSIGPHETACPHRGNPHPEYSTEYSPPPSPIRLLHPPIHLLRFNSPPLAAAAADDDDRLASGGGGGDGAGGPSRGRAAGDPGAAGADGRGGGGVRVPEAGGCRVVPWARGTLAASLLVPSARGLAVAKSPFVTLSIDETGETVAAMGDVPVSVNFVGNNHIVVEAAAASSGDDDDEAAMEGGSPPEVMYMHFANRRSPGAGRKRRSKQGRRRGRAMEAEHFVRIADAEPTEARPLQGLWKVLPLHTELTPLLLHMVGALAFSLEWFIVMIYYYHYSPSWSSCGVASAANLGISESRTLEFYLVTYDDIGGITCRQVSDTRGQNSGFTPIFWTTNTTFLEQPFSEKELDHYIRREHIQGVDSDHAATENRAISRILCINSSYDVVDHHLSAPLDDMRNVEGRIWLYDDGTFGFGFSGSNSIIDLKHVSSDGCILDALH
uniref:Uncharacterized protein n=1 Tax=Oryza barthii TaxID=65489 RepID=A0A0D3HUY3_9ORYZ